MGQALRGVAGSGTHVWRRTGQSVQEAEVQRLPSASCVTSPRVVRRLERVQSGAASACEPISADPNCTGGKQMMGVGYVMVSAWQVVHFQ